MVFGPLAQILFEFIRIWGPWPTFHIFRRGLDDCVELRPHLQDNDDNDNDNDNDNNNYNYNNNTNNDEKMIVTLLIIIITIIILIPGRGPQTAVLRQVGQAGWLGKETGRNTG